VTVGLLGAGFVWDIAHTNSTSPDLELPKWIVYLRIRLGSYLMCFRFLQVAWSFARTGALPHHDADRNTDLDLLIIVVIGGIYTRIFTPTETAAMSAVYAFFVAVFVYRDMPLSKVPKVVLDSANMSAMLLYLVLVTYWPALSLVLLKTLGMMG
jgi:tripartite ATP-independent transporter DctM subunit